MAPVVDKAYREEIEKAGTELKKLSKEEAPNLLRLAYASQFSIANYHDDAARTKATPSDGAYKNTLDAIKKIKDNYPTITYPDFYQLAGVVAVAALEGPKIEFIPGREESSISPDESCLPDVTRRALDLKGVFDKVGIHESKHIVALCGGLKLARPVQGSTLKFDNSYFVELTKKDSNPTDKALLDDPEFKDYVQSYARNNDAFINDYKEAHKKLSELGLPPRSSCIRSAVEKGTVLVNNTVTQRAVLGVAVAATIVILGVFYLINRRRAKHSSPQFQ